MGLFVVEKITQNKKYKTNFTLKIIKALITNLLEKCKWYNTNITKAFRGQF